MLVKTKAKRIIGAKGGEERDMLCAERKYFRLRSGRAKSAKRSYNKRVRKQNIVDFETEETTGVLYTALYNEEALKLRGIPYSEVAVWDYEDFIFFTALEVDASYKLDIELACIDLERIPSFCDIRKLNEK